MSYDKYIPTPKWKEIVDEGIDTIRVKDIEIKKLKEAIKKKDNLIKDIMEKINDIKAIEAYDRFLINKKETNND